MMLYIVLFVPYKNIYTKYKYKKEEEFLFFSSSSSCSAHLEMLMYKETYQKKDRDV